jgi:hypothetical protein
VPKIFESNTSGSTPAPNQAEPWTSCNRFLVYVFDKINRTTHGNLLLEGGGDVTDVTVTDSDGADFSQLGDDADFSELGGGANFPILEFPSSVLAV